jgi:hypothetical protein
MKMGYIKIAGSEVCGEEGGLPLKTTGHKRGSLELNGYNFSSGETLVDMYKLKEAMKKSYSDLLVIHQRQCTHGKMEIL